MTAPKRTTGKLLVATPDLEDPNFKRAVVFMIEHSEEGALGVIVNRQSTTPVDELIPQWASYVSDPSLVFLGGPVNPDGVIALGQTSQDSTEGFQRFGDNDLGTVDLNADPALLNINFDHLRLFAGHAGWGAGQLESELRRKGWYVLEAQNLDLFATDCDELWFQVLGRQRGELSWLAHYPDDPKQN